ncbi:hypothetical protein KZO01_15090 [Kurthia zopfii]|uniref:Uncharacterized protein n=1 Tax=Kurthia zopfii TaxID=1650 RepID=A0A8B4QAX4_9BACL|nr:hypothetical protein [Kurthia zopfii]PWI21678.1 hypothetical protein DF281_10825 [Kurthia zopfii]TDR35758.1 hypothetical protein DFR61_12930 [Kurthia zopfii]GEK31200.1 hypothetical protein KZO01_15090 [Kurthia zopfii]STX09913.1 Uncharacterised protein [Kurthia zopfii]
MNNEKNNEGTLYLSKIQPDNQGEQTLSDEIIAMLESIQHHLNQNFSTRHTAKKLREIISDLNPVLKVLLIGDTESRKSQFINTILNRHLMPTEFNGVSRVNSIIHFGEVDQVTAHFLDGQVAIFDAQQIELFAVSDTFSSQMMRDGLDYLDIQINHDLLKSFAFLDTASYEKNLFIKESFLNRCPSVLWILNSDFKNSPTEKLMQAKLEHYAKSLHFIKTNDNIICDGKRQMTVSLPLMTEAIVENDSSKFAQSNFDSLLQMFNDSKQSIEMYRTNLMDRLFKWINRFSIESTSLVNRDPYKEAYSLLKEFSESGVSLMSMSAEFQQQIKIFDVQYESIRGSFQQLETAHQLIVFLKENELQKKVEVQQFINLYESYSSEVIEYRKVFKNEESEAQKQVAEKIQQSSQQVLLKFDEVKNIIFKLVQNKLLIIENQILEVKTQIEYRLSRLFNATKRLQAFDVIVEAKKEIELLIEQFEPTQSNKMYLEMVKEIPMDHQQYVQSFLQQRAELMKYKVDKKSQAIYKEVLEKINIIMPL